MQRYYRAINEKIYLLDASKKKKNGIVTSVRGSSLNVYEQLFEKENISCSCPDHLTRGNFCKHLLFVVGKVAQETTMAQNLCVSPHLWDKDHLKIVRDSLMARLKIEKKPKKKTERDDVDDCPICFDEITKDDETYQCSSTCKNYFHLGCINKWIETNKYNKTCPLCRTSIEINGNDKYINDNIKFIYDKS
jgi:hypothetical protein